MQDFKKVSVPSTTDNDQTAVDDRISNMLLDVFREVHGKAQSGISSSLTLTLKLDNGQASTINNIIRIAIENALPDLGKDVKEPAAKLRQPDIHNAVKSMLDSIDFMKCIEHFAPNALLENKRHVEKIIKSSYLSPLTVGIYNSDIGKIGDITDENTQQLAHEPSS